MVLVYNGVEVNVVVGWRNSEFGSGGRCGVVVVVSVSSFTL
jgi:hypothetical protein